MHASTSKLRSQFGLKPSGATHLDQGRQVHAVASPPPVRWFAHEGTRRRRRTCLAKGARSLRPDRCFRCNGGCHHVLAQLQQPFGRRGSGGHRVVRTVGHQPLPGAFALEAMQAAARVSADDSDTDVGLSVSLRPSAMRRRRTPQRPVVFRGMASALHSLCEFEAVPRLHRSTPPRMAGESAYWTMAPLQTVAGVLGEMCSGYAPAN